MTQSWVDAAPFRAHLLHVCAATGLPWQVLGLHAGLPLRLGERLVAGRRGSRLPPAYAARILALTCAEARGLRSASVSAGPTATRLATLRASGVTARRLATVLGCTAEHVEALASGRVTRTTAEIALRVQVLEERSWRRAPHRAAAAA